MFDPFGPAVIAWNGSYEAANAVRNAVGLLKLSSNVRIIRFINGEQAPPTVLLEYLSRHGVHAELDTWVLKQDPVEELLVQYATQKKASYIVMGGYGHNRAGEFLFGARNSFPAESLSGRFGARSLGPVNISVFY